MPKALYQVLANPGELELNKLKQRIDALEKELQELREQISRDLVVNIESEALLEQEPA